ncbi:MAG: hypothetical protein ACLTJG_18865 [[Clostridium] innocuum]
MGAAAYRTGIVALMALNILKEFQFAQRDEEMFHHQFGSNKWHLQTAASY